MILEPYTPEQKSRFPKTKFTLVGTLLKITDTGILIQKVNTNAKFWIDINGGSINLDENEMGNFHISASTYVGKDNGVLITKLRLIDSFKITTEVQSDHPGFIGDIEGTIDEVIETDIASLKILKITTGYKGSDGDGNLKTGYLRYFTDKSIRIEKRAEFLLDLRSTSKLVDTSGKIFVSKKNISYTDKEGKQVNKTVDRGFPSLEVKGLNYK